MKTLDRDICGEKGVDEDEAIEIKEEENLTMPESYKMIIGISLVILKASMKKLMKKIYLIMCMIQSTRAIWYSSLGKIGKEK